MNSPFSFVITIALCFGMNLSLLAQESQHQPKPYVSADGKTYWNKNQPVYLRLASSPNEKGILLKNDEQPEYNNPIFFDTEGINYIRTKQAVNNQTMEVHTDMEVLLPVYADGMAPKTSPHFHESESHVIGEKKYFGKGLKITLESNDQVSGVESIYYSTNGDEFHVYTDPFSYDLQTDSLLTYYAVDHVGNVEQKRTEHIILDYDHPVTTFETVGPSIDDSYSYGAYIHLSSIDSLSGVEASYYRFDDGKFQKYDGNDIPMDLLQDGRHILEFYAKDNVGNEAPVESFAFYFDRSPPLMASDILGDRFIVEDQIYFSGRTKLKLTAVDNKVGVKEIKYSIDDSEFQAYENPFYLPNQTGIHSIKYYAVDRFGNKTSDENTSRSFHEFEHRATKVYVDLTGPNLNYTFLGELINTRDTVFVNSKTKLQFQAEDSGSGVQKITYSLEGSAEEFDFEDDLSFEKAGYHAIDFYGYDNVNNRNLSHMDLYVDNEAPEVFLIFSSTPLATKDTIKTYYKDVSVYLAAQDAHIGLSSLSYSLNGKPEKEYEGRIRKLAKNKVNSLVIRARDELGNERIRKVTFKVSSK